MVAVVEHGSFTAAAASIPVSQPALSQAVAGLERELGAPLFHRIGRRVALTPAGEAFVEPARRMLLDVVARPTLVVEPLVGLGGRFRHQHPGVLVRISEPEDADSIAELVRTGESELGLGDIEFDAPDLATDRLGQQRLLAVLPPGTEPEDPSRITVRDLAALPLITTPRGTSTRRLLASALRRREPDTEPRIGVVTEHREAIVPLVMAGAGAAVLPEPIARSAAALGAVVLPLARPLSRPVVLVRRDAPLSPAAAAFRTLALDLATTATATTDD